MRGGPIRFHAHEIPLSLDTVRQLLTHQFPRWADRSLRFVDSPGTSHSLIRLGEDLVLRFPRTESAGKDIAFEHTWLPRLAPSLPLAIPEPIATGEPGEDFPWRWSVLRWIDGAPHEPSAGSVSVESAAALAAFCHALRECDPTGGPDARTEGLRGAPLSIRDEETRAALIELRDEIDLPHALSIWDDALAAAPFDDAPVWFHGDLLPGNLLFRDGVLTAVLDFGCAGVGDPACDATPGWSIFEGESRQAFWRELAIDRDTWRRARGLALSQAAIYIPYYRSTFPLGVARAEWQLREVLADRDPPA